MNFVANNEIILHCMDQWTSRQLTITLGVDPLTELADYRGDLRVTRECRNGIWRLEFFTSATDEAGQVGWSFLRGEEFATVDVDNVKINRMARVFKAIARTYHSLDWRAKPSSVYLIALRVAQMMVERPQLEIVDYITNDMFQEQGMSIVTALGTLEVVGAQYEDIRRIDTIVLARDVRVGLDTDEEILCSWPVVVCGDVVAFNQHIPGPVLSLGNLSRQFNVIDLNTKDMRWTCSTQHEIFDHVFAEGTAKMRKYHPEKNKWVIYELNSGYIRPLYVEGQELEVDAGAVETGFTNIE